MKKHLVLLPVLLIAFLLLSCNSKNKSDEVAGYVYEERETEINPELQKKIGNWIERDIVCYGLVVAVDNEGIPVRGKPVKSKVINFETDGVKMKALESVNISPKSNQNENGIRIGTVWLEKEGELFRTKEEADEYLKSKNLFMN